MTKLRTLSLFSGIGGIELGLERTGGFSTVGFCEIDKHCHKVLNKHWPEVPIFKDVNTLCKSDIPDGVDVITGGFPCTDVSYAGNAKGLFDENGNRTRSGLWKEYARIIDEFRPKFCLIENVGHLRKNGLGIVLADLARIGYDAEWYTITADCVGYPHQRERLFIISYPRSQRLDGNIGEERHLQDDSERSSSPAHSEREECQSELSEVRKVLSRGTFDSIRSTYSDERAIVSSVRRVTDGIPEGLDERRRKQRVKQVGNAVVPRIAEIIGNAILEFIK
jgi:DNA (cytosine-5)-methyltransferase 1